MTAVRRLAAVTGSVVLAASGLTALTATPATAAVLCARSQTKVSTGVKITYTKCVNGEGDTRLSGTLTDTLTDRMRAWAEIKIGPWHSMMSTGSSQTYSTGWQPSGEISIAIWRD
jgi:hypothetical protein